MPGFIDGSVFPPVGGSGSSAWSAITGKPSTFPPDAHTQAISTVTGLSAAIATIPVKGTATVTVPNGSREWSEIVTATGVTGASVILITVAAHADSDENGADMLDLVSMSATPGTDQIAVEMAFSTPQRGEIKLNWMAA